MSVGLWRASDCPSSALARCDHRRWGCLPPRRVRLRALVAAIRGHRGRPCSRSPRQSPVVAQAPSSLIRHTSARCCSRSRSPTWRRTAARPEVQLGQRADRARVDEDASVGVGLSLPGSPRPLSWIELRFDTLPPGSAWCGVGRVCWCVWLSPLPLVHTSSSAAMWLGDSNIHRTRKVARTPQQATERWPVRSPGGPEEGEAGGGGSTVDRLWIVLVDLHSRRLDPLYRLTLPTWRR